MLVFVFLFTFITFYYLNYWKSRKVLYEFYRSVPNIGGSRVLGHTHWFVASVALKVRNDLFLIYPENNTL